MEEMWKKWLRENNLEYYKEMENSIRWAIEWREDQINKRDEIIYELNVKNKNLEARIKELEDEKLRFYKADGTFEICKSAEEVIERRKKAAIEIDKLKNLLKEIKQLLQKL